MAAPLLLFLPDLVEARSFYEGVLGYVVREEGSEHLALERDGEALLLVFRCAAPAPAQEHARSAATVAVFLVDDIAAAMAQMRAKGVAFLHEQHAANAYGRYAAFRAPGGLIHEILQPN